MANKATQTQVYLGSISVDGLRIEEGKYGMYLSQLSALCGVSANNFAREAARAIKQFQSSPILASEKGQALVNQGLQSSPISVEGLKATAKYINIEDVPLIVRLLDKAGYPQAGEVIDVLSGLALHQVFADAFNDKFEKEERQNYLLARTQGKETRKTWATSVHDWVIRKNLTNQPRGKFCYRNATEKLYQVCFGLSCKQMTLQFGENPRNNLSADDLKFLDMVETLAMHLIDQCDVYPVSAVVLVFQNNFLKSRVPQRKLEVA